MAQGRSIFVGMCQINVSTYGLIYCLSRWILYGFVIIIMMVPFTSCTRDSQICIRSERTVTCKSPPPRLPDCTLCRYRNDVNMNLISIAKENVTTDNVEEFSQDVLDTISNGADINSDGLQAVAISLQKIVEVRMPSQKVTQNIIQIVDNILDVPDEEFVMATNDEAPTNILDSLEQQITLYQTQGNGNNLTVIGNNIAIEALQIPETSLNAGLGFGTSISTDSEENGTKTNILSDIQTIVFSESDDISSAVFDTSIFLPPYLADLISPNMQSARGNGSVPVTFFIFLNSKLFQDSNQHSDQLMVSTRVVSATVEGVKVKSMSPGREVNMSFLELNATNGKDKMDSRTCGFWEKTDQGGRWSSEGCRREDDIDINKIRCLCDHLTSFAVLLHYEGGGGPVPFDVLSVIGCSISIICLLITLVTYLSMKELRSKLPRQIMMNLCFTLLGLYLVFVIGIDRRFPTTGCMIVGFLIHFFLLSSMSWMLVEAINMYLLFVLVMKTRISRFLIKASICAYGLPLIVCLITLLVHSEVYLGDNTYCFVKPGPALHYGVLLIVTVLLTINLVIFGMVMQRISCRRSRTDNHDTWRRVQNAIAISFLLGLTWLFGLLAIDSARLPFKVLFVIFNSFQGLFIFLMFCVRHKEIREQWVRWMYFPVYLCRREESVEDKDKQTGSSRVVETANASLNTKRMVEMVT